VRLRPTQKESYQFSSSPRRIPNGLKDRVKRRLIVGAWIQQADRSRLESIFDLMGMYNLTRGAGGLKVEERLAIAEAMMAVNWLASIRAP
jgi:hypothetical protein